MNTVRKVDFMKGRNDVSKRPHNLAHINRDRGYRHVDRDPVLAEVTRVITESGKPLAWIEEQSGVTSSTMSNWLNGKTKKPQHITVSFVLKALGYGFKLVKL